MDFQNERIIKKPRKQKRCYWCNEWCEIGQERVNITGVWDSDFFSNHYHPECLQANRDWFELPENKGEYENPECRMERGKTTPKNPEID